MEQPPRVLMLGSLPLAAPWNGADKMLARTIVTADTRTRYIVQTGMREAWPDHVAAVRQREVQDMPGTAARLGAARYILGNTRDADLVHVVATVQPSSAVPARILWAWCRAAGRPLVHTLPAIASPDAIDLAALPGDVTVALSRYTTERLRAAGVRDVVSLFPPLPLGELRPRAGSERLRRQYRLGPLPVLYAAHLDSGSGIAEAIQSLAALPESLRDVTLVLALRWRSGQDVRAELRRLRAIADAAGVTDRVRWLTRVADMPALISTCAVTVLVPERLAGKMDLPLVLLESLALGRPIVVADRAPMNEVQLGGGLAVPFGDIGALAHALTSLLDDEVLRVTLARVGRRNVLAAADPGRIATAYTEIYDRASDRVPGCRSVRQNGRRPAAAGGRAGERID